MEHHIDLSDIRFDIFNVMESEYLQYINFGLNIIEPSPTPHIEYFRTVIGIGKTIEVQRRDVYDVMTALGDIGGVYGIVFGTFYGFTFIFVDSFYATSLIQVLFKAATSNAPMKSP